MSQLTYAIVGATGAVGREMCSILEDRGSNFGSLRLLASARSAGESITVGNKEFVVSELKDDSFEGVDVALFSAGSGVSKKFAPIAREAGAIVIDNSSAFRMDDDVPLVVPEVNGSELREELVKLAPEQGMIIANPNCSTIQLVVVLKPILDAAGLERVVVSTYQSVSGAGQKGMDELWKQTLSIFGQGEGSVETFQHRIAFNCIPHIDVFLEDGYTNEEAKVIRESRKILSQPNLRITATAVRVPVFVCHAESVNVQTTKRLSREDCQALLRESPGVMLQDKPSENSYPLGVELGGTDATYVGRIREDESAENALNLWIVADNLRKGAALNALQIAEIVSSVR